jgi:hypothetical protein
MFDRNLVIGTNDGPLQETPNVLYGVGVNIATDILFDGVVDRLVPCVFVSNAPVRSPVVSIVSLGVIGGCFGNKLVKGLTGPIWGQLENDLPFPLYGSNDYGLVAGEPTPLSVSLTADIGFIEFDDAPELDGRRFVHSGSDTVAEIPSGFVGHVDGTLDLVGGNRLFGLNHQICCQKPLSKGQMGVLEDRPRSDRELVVA